MNDNGGGAVIIFGLGICLDEAAIQTLDNFVNNGKYGSTREDACRAFICQKVGMDPAACDPENQPRERSQLPAEAGGASDDRQEAAAIPAAPAGEVATEEAAGGHGSDAAVNQAAEDSAADAAIATEVEAEAQADEASGGPQPNA